MVKLKKHEIFEKCEIKNPHIQLGSVF